MTRRRLAVIVVVVAILFRPLRPGARHARTAPRQVTAASSSGGLLRESGSLHRPWRHLSGLGPDNAGSAALCGRPSRNLLKRCGTNVARS